MSVHCCIGAALASFTALPFNCHEQNYIDCRWKGSWFLVMFLNVHGQCCLRYRVWSYVSRKTMTDEGCCSKNRVGGKDCETGTQNAGNFSVKNSHLGILYVYLLLQYFHIILIYATNDSAYSSMSETLQLFISFLRVDSLVRQASLHARRSGSFSIGTLAQSCSLISLISW